jgi:branched-chain amino acid aminotransferase
VCPGELGSILPGVTRMTVVDLLAEMGERVIERDIHLSEVSDVLAGEDGLSMFTTSTALGIRQVARLRLGSRDHKLDGDVPSAWRQGRSALQGALALHSCTCLQRDRV